MNNNFIIIAIVGAFIVGGISANPIADAVKPLTEIIVANDKTNPIPTELTSESLMIKDNTAGSPYPILCDGDVEFFESFEHVHASNSGDESFGAFHITSPEPLSLVLRGGNLERNLEEFQITGIITDDRICNLPTPAVFTLSGECGFDKPVLFTTSSGIGASVTSHVACP